MPKLDIPKAYEASRVEDAIYKKWEESGFFNPENLPGSRKKSFSIAMPPPNATGILHVGHAVMLAIQDIATRFQRMRGKRTLWLPGTDHAAIATQTVVEKIIAKEGKTRQGMGREKFLERVNEFVKNSQNAIHEQMRKMGASCDWSRERYTLDDGLSKAVSEAFVRMYNDDLIYRGYRIVNWCPRCGSTLADDEVEHTPSKSKLYWIKYGPFILATVRPETKLGDTAVAVHPDDARYQKYVGKKFKIPGVLGEFEVVVVADKVVDPKFGSGIIKVTPAHDFTDYDIAQRHKIPIKQVIDKQGKMMANCGKYAGMTTKECREAIVEDMKKMGLIEKIEDYKNNIAVCYRCGTLIEPIPSEQWFISVDKPTKVLGGKSLKEKAIEVVKKNEIAIVPDRFKKTYFQWMENLHDWCISRQIWFGHRIPVYYRKQEISKSQFPISNESVASRQNEDIYVGVEPPKGDGWEQDPDTLDTWFSSGLWTFSTLGWPENSKDLKTYHPTSLMETAYDILFFWVARMIIMSNYLMKEVPFETVYIHGLIKDKNGQKMSKSKPETVIDPLDMIKKYGADAMRLALVIGNTPGNDSRLYEEKIAGFRNFTNKLWNISRFIFNSVEKVQFISTAPVPKTLSDKYILKTFENIKSIVTQDLEEYRFSQAGEVLREFSWNDLADWYIEISKISNFQFPISNDGIASRQNLKLKQNTDEILLYILEQLLMLWHPFMPFVTEEIFKNFQSDELLMVRKWPKVNTALHNQSKSILTDFTEVQKVVIAIRNLKAENGLASRYEVPVAFYAKKSSLKSLHLEEMKVIIEKLAGVRIELVTQYMKKRPRQSAFTVAGNVEIYLSITGIIDIDEKRKEIADKETYIKKIEEKLSNEEFMKKAPKQIIDNEKKKLSLQKDELHKLKESIKNLI